MSGLAERLSLSLHRAEGECFPSLVARLAEHNQCSVGALVCRMGIEPSRFVPVGLMTQAERVRAAAVVGTDEGDIAASLLSNYGSAMPTLQRTATSSAERLEFERVAARTEWALVHRTRLCPLCLEDNGQGIAGVFRLDWRIGLAAVCTRHNLHLCEHCPSCGADLGVSQRRGFLSGSPLPIQCGRKLTRGRNAEACAADLRTVAAISVTSQRLLDAQKLYLRALNPHVVDVHQDLAMEIRRCVSLLLAHPDRVELGEVDEAAASAFDKYVSTRSGAWIPNALRRPAPAAVVAAVLPAAAELATIEEEALPGALIDTLGDALTAVHGWTPVQESPRLREALRQASSMVKRARRQIEPSPAAAKALPGLTIAQVPQLFWLPEYQAYLRAFQPGRNSRMFRRLCSEMLTRELGGPTWDEIGALLELPHVEKTVAYFRARLRSNGTYDVFVKEVLRATKAAIARIDPPVNYQRRRHVLATLTIVPAEYARAPSQLERVLAATWLWAELTQGDPSLSPASRASGDLFQHRSPVEVLRPVAKTASFRKLTPALLNYGHHLLVEGREQGGEDDELMLALHSVVARATRRPRGINTETGVAAPGPIEAPYSGT